MEGFSQAGVLATNDPSESRLKLAAVCDVVESELFIEPQGFLLGRVRPDRGTTVSLIVASARRGAFELQVVECNQPDLSFTVAPAEADFLTKLGMQSGYRLTLTLKENVESCEIDHWVRIRLSDPHDPDFSKVLQLPIMGRILRRVAVYGDSIDASGTIAFGVLPAGQEHVRKLVVKVNDPEPQLKIRKIESNPEFVEAKLTPYGDQENLYQLTVTLPASAGTSVHRADHMGKLKFEFDHPRIKDLELQLDFLLKYRQGNTFKAR